MSVYKKLQAVQKATRSLAPNAKGQTGNASYGYVSGAKLLERIRPIMDKEGLILTQEVVECINTPTTYTTSKGSKTEMFTTLRIRFTWIDTEDESKLVNEFYANGMNAWDKGLGSALTYAERYYLMKLFHIATDEDDVDALIKDEAIVEASQPAPQSTPTPVQQPVQQTSAPQSPAREVVRPEDQKRWAKAVDYCVKNNWNASVLLTWFDITPENIAKLDLAIANNKACFGAPVSDNDSF